MSGDADPGEEVIDATAHDAGVSVVTQRGATIGLEVLFGDQESHIGH